MTDDLDHNHSLLIIPPSTQDRRKGVLSAPVVLVMYGDYQRSQSADVYRLIRVIQQQLSVSLGENYLCFIFRHFPQVQVHAHALRAAEAAEAAAVQSWFWQMHDTLFEHQQELANGYLVQYANDLELNISQFLQDMSKHVHIARIHKNLESGLRSGVTTSPALFINGIRYIERWNIEPLMAAIINAGH